MSALRESLELLDALRERGHRPAFVDIGGGIPMSYLDDAEAWERFWREHRAGLLGRREPLTFEGHGLGLTAHAGEISGRPNLYPYYQELTRGAWLARVLEAEVRTSTGAQTIAEALRDAERSAALRAGTIAARRLRSHCRSRGVPQAAPRRHLAAGRGDESHAVPLDLRRLPRRSPARCDCPRTASTGAIEGFLVGAYCIERELLTWRRLRFPRGVEVGDVVVFPNTAGYLMHILESSSHQIPLARNLVAAPPERPFLDPIDSGGRSDRLICLAAGTSAGRATTGI